MDSDGDSRPNAAEARQRKKKVGAQFVMLPLRILRDPTLRPVEKIVLADYLSYTGKNNQTCFPAQARVASDLGVNRGTVNGAMKQLLQRGAIRRLRRGRGFNYDLGPVYEMLKNPSAALLVAENNPSQGFAPEGDDVVDSTTLWPENPAYNDGEMDTNYISVSDQTNYMAATPEDYVCGTETEPHPMCGFDASRAERALDVPAPTSGSGTSFGGFEFEAKEAALRLGLRTCCPDDENARADIEEAILFAGGEPLNRGALDKLIDRYGIVACWSQAKYLEESIERYPTRVERPTALYVRSVEANAGGQVGLSRQERIADYVDRFCRGEINYDEFPEDLSNEIWRAIPDDKIPF